MAHNMAFGELERQVENAIAGSRDFAYETNFNSTPLFWPERFKDKGYEIRMIYLVLDSIDEAVRRVAVRVQNGGHFVSENEIRKRYFQGFENLDRHFGFFDLIDVFDCSEYEHEPKFCFSIFDGEINYLREFPEFLKRLVPNLYDSVSG